MRLFAILLIFVCSMSPATNLAQGNRQSGIAGKVSEENGSIIPFASIAVYKSGDSSLVTGGTSNESGRFAIDLKPGSYYVKITFLSFEELTVPNVEVTDRELNLGTVVLKAGNVELSAVEVTAQRSQMELQLDKRVFNVGSDLTNRGGNAVELLDNVPSVAVDVDGNVSLRGSENVRILIDGKPSGLTGISSTDALRQLQSSMIERIEIITNPSARYEAEGEVGIINIVLKKERRSGTNGTFEVGAGTPDNYNASVNLNFRQKKINLFTNYSINYRELPGSGKSEQQFFGDSLYSFSRDRKHTRGGLSHNLQAGFEFYLGARNTITASGMYRYSKGDNESRIVYRDFNSNEELQQIVTRTDEEVETKDNTEFSLDHLYTFEQKGRQLSSSFKFINSVDTELSDILEFDDQGNVPIEQRSTNGEDERNILFQSDYVHPINKSGKFEAGVRSTFRKIENDFLVEERASDGVWNPYSAFDNHFIYTENIHAAYIMAGNKSGKLSYQAGLRAELSDIGTELTETKQLNEREYLNLFPSTHLAYELDSSNTIQLSYSRRLSRPRFRHLLPFYSFSDSRNIFSGNPDLDPEYTNSFELGHLKYFSFGSVLSSVYYRHRKGVIERITVVDSTDLTRIFPVNLSTQDAFGLEFNINLDLYRWWRVNGSFNFYRAITSGSYEETNLYSDTYTWTAQGSSRFRILNAWDFQTSIRYRAPEITTQGKRLSITSVDLGLSRDILDGKGNITFSARDIFNSRKRRTITEGENFYSESEFQWRARQFLVSLTYRLNQDKKRSRKSEMDGEGGDSGEMQF